MGRYLIRRTLFMILVLFIVSLITFIIFMALLVLILLYVYRARLLEGVTE